MCVVAVVGEKLDDNADIIRYIWHCNLNVKEKNISLDFLVKYKYKIFAKHGIFYCMHCLDWRAVLESN